MLPPDFQDLVTQWMVQTVARLAPRAAARPAYGGLIFEAEPGLHRSLICGLYAYRDHIAVEFSNGADLDDPFAVLEGKGKFRRHIKLRSMGDILAKDVDGMIARAFARPHPETDAAIDPLA